MSKILKKVPSIHRRGFLYEKKEKEMEKCANVLDIPYDLNDYHRDMDNHKYKYIGSYDISIDGIGGVYWECSECGNIEFDEPDNI